MKYIIPFLSIVILISCKQQNSEVKLESKENDRTEVTSCIETSIVLRDTTSLSRIGKEFEGRPVMSYNSANETYRTFLSEPEFQIIIKSIKKLMNKPESFVYSDILGEPMNSNEIKNRMIICDSILESNFDASGKETVVAILACDSTSEFKHINMIKFYESWFVNNKTNLLEKEMLGYSVFGYDYDKRAYKELFSVFNDSISREKVRNKFNL